MKERTATFRNLTLRWFGPWAKPYDDPSIIDLYESNFRVDFPELFSSFLLAANGATVEALYFHPDLNPEEYVFPIWQVASIGHHRFNDQNDLLVATEYEHYNCGTIPEKVIVFAFERLACSIYLDLTDEGAGRVAVRETIDHLPHSTWTYSKSGAPATYIAESFEDYLSRLVPDPDPPGVY